MPQAASVPVVVCEQEMWLTKRHQSFYGLSFGTAEPRILGTQKALNRDVRQLNLVKASV